MIESDLLAELKKGNIDALEYVYNTHKSPFFNFARKYNLHNDDLIDIYQDAILALRENAINGKIDNLKSEIKTYLFSIGKYMIYDTLRRKNKLRLVDSNLIIENKEETFEQPLFKTELNEQQLKMQKAFKALGEKCKELITLFYYRGFTIDEITQHLNYSNKDVVKSQKSRCIKTMKSSISKNEQNG